MGDVVRYMHRASWLLRQGKPANDVAILLPEDDAQAAFTPGHVSVTDEMKRRISPALMSSILDAGYNLDYIDAATIDKLGQVPYPVVVLPPTDRIPLPTYKLLAAYIARGGHVIPLGSLPSLAPGLNHQADDAAIAALTKQIFQGTAAISPADLPAALHRALPPDLTSTNLPDPAAAGGDANSGLGFIHRKLPGSDVYFVVNSSSMPLATSLTFRAKHNRAWAFSLDTGRPLGRQSGNAPISVTLSPYQSIVFILDERPPNGASGDPDAGLAGIGAGEVCAQQPGKTLDRLDGGWTLAFPGSKPQPLTSFTSWASLPGRKFYSGEAVYSATFRLNEASIPANRLFLNFGAGTPMQDNRRPGSAGIHALIDPPIRDAAIIFVNGKRVGSLWHPPYQVEVSPYLRRGDNSIEVHVYNTAVNSLAGQPARDYTTLNAKYGKRFDTQDMNLIESLPSGLLFAPTLSQGNGRPACIEIP